MSLSDIWKFRCSIDSGINSRRKEVILVEVLKEDLAIKRSRSVSEVLS